MRRRPRRPTRTDPLLPYTPLLRSGGAEVHVGDAAGPHEADIDPGLEHQDVLPAEQLVLATRLFLRAHVDGVPEQLAHPLAVLHRSEEHTSELQSLMCISYAVFCLKKKNSYTSITTPYYEYTC